MRAIPALLRGALVAALSLGLLAIVALGIAYLYFSPELPDAETLKQVHFQEPLRVYSRDGSLLAEYGQKRRLPLSIDEIPQRVRKAFLAAEDDRFYEHPGVDYQGLIRATIQLLLTGEKRQGGSTITMQVARNFFLDRDKTYTRKIKEIFLALEIERILSKPEILELYLNKIYLGSRAYGVGAAAQIYYGKSLDELDLAQVAMIAGLPKAPSRYNPLAGPERAVARRNYVLGRMHELGFIDDAAYDRAREAPVTASRHRARVDLDAAYVGEMVRAEMVARHGKAAYSAGYKVYTTIDARLQRAAQRAVRDNLIAYTERHGYRGPEATVPLDVLGHQEAMQQALEDYQSLGGLRPALVIAVKGKEAAIFLKGGERATLSWQGMKWAKPHIDHKRVGKAPEKAADVVSAGDVVRLRRDPESEAWRLTQVPKVSGAIVAMDPNDGAVLALVGGFDFQRSKFNRATQARRQPGSNFKPFIYSAALADGFTPASIINDAPVVFDDAALEDTWRPENYSGTFFGPTRLRVALMKSRNLVSIRLLRQMGIGHAIDHITRFGFDEKQLPRDLTLALGSGTVTPMQLVRGFSVLANGGFRVRPYFMDRILDADGSLRFEAARTVAGGAKCEASAQAKGSGEQAQGGQGDAGKANCQPAPRAIPADNAYQMVSMLRDVIQHGTGQRAKALGRKDLAGKTGTTNDQHDAWFSGFNLDIAATTWVGFDEMKPLGPRETGAVAALPAWMDFMKTALKGRPERTLDQPEGLVTVRIDPDTGLRTQGNGGHAIFETFRVEHVPKMASREGSQPQSQDGSTTQMPEQLF